MLLSLSGAPDSRWDNNVLHSLGAVIGSNFEAVDGTALMIEIELSSRTLGRIWPWIVAAIGVLIVVVGAVLYSPDAQVASSGPSPSWFG